MCLWKRKLPIWHLIQEWPHGLQQPFWLQCYSGWDDHQKLNILQTKHKDNHMQLNRNQKTFLVVGCEVLRSNQKTPSGRHLWQPYECPYWLDLTGFWYLLSIMFREDLRKNKMRIYLMFFFKNPDMTFEIVLSGHPPFRVSKISPSHGFYINLEF